VFANRSLGAPVVTTRNTRTLRGLDFDLLSETEVVRDVIDKSREGHGGWVVTPNTDILRQVRKSAEAFALVRQASLTVPDGMPLIWAAKIRGKPLVERVTGSSLIYTLTEAAAEAGLSVYMLGGEPGVPEAAAENLVRRFQGLKVVGAHSPPLGFEKSSTGMAEVRERLLEAAPNIVYVGLGFPKQERVISELVPIMASTWFIGCGAAIPFAAGKVPRAPVWMQRCSLEWVHRLAIEPRRLSKRYLLHDLPFGLSLLALAAIDRISAIGGKELERPKYTRH
jgi:N-acetylglucosaminyldiphosphoundecaprenol N-acetyl-beta-D-mannosaminyltransferase